MKTLLILSRVGSRSAILWQVPRASPRPPNPRRLPKPRFTPSTVVDRHEANYFAEAGLRVETLFIQNSSTVIQSLLAGE